MNFEVDETVSDEKVKTVLRVYKGSTQIKFRRIGQGQPSFRAENDVFKRLINDRCDQSIKLPMKEQAV